MRWLWRGWLLLLALTLAGGAASLLRPPATRAPVVVAVPPAPARLVPAVSEPVLRVPGTTGTIPLPPLPVPDTAAAALAAAEPGVTAARPFSLAGASTLDRARATECLTDAIYYEAAREPVRGQQAVAQVILNRVRHPAFPATVCGVVYQGAPGPGCQFSFACDGALARVPSRTGWARAARVAAAALAGYVEPAVGLATHYHTYRVTPAWIRALMMTDAIGAHFFHRWKGYWGTAAAFSQRYAGGEPMPGPRAATLPVVVAPVPNEQPAFIQPRLPPAAPVAPDNLPAASTVLPRWKDSGKPL